MGDTGGLNLDTDYYNKPIKCSECGDTDLKYEGLGSYRCMRCRHVMYDDYGKVREYLDSHRGATVVEVSDATGISKGKIRQMLKDDRIEIAPGSAMFIFCEKCGAPIRSGRFCNSCANEKSSAMIAAQKEQSGKPKMQGFGATRSDGKGAKRFTRQMSQKQ